MSVMVCERRSFSPFSFFFFATHRFHVKQKKEKQHGGLSTINRSSRTLMTCGWLRLYPDAKV